MRITIATRLLAMIALLAACGGSSDTVSYTVRVTAIDLVQKGGSRKLAVDGLPSQSGTLIQPRRGPDTGATN